ncbi:MAG: 4Fe-4S binding protein [Betaproteobacteria bacterium HGW-Betaproteobacteria-12]|nr:MAG: 4Fe-4S binding protein [Betaproteobacteria bacterium HGW-Betaproteobacteria-12]
MKLPAKLHRFPAGLLPPFFALLVALLFAVSWSSGHAASYDAPLPAQLFTDPDLCAYAPCRAVMPGADSFSPRKGRPSYVEAYRGSGAQRQLLGYVFLSTDIVDIPAYSGKPVITLIGMYPQGVISGVRILKHSEPILLVGIPESELDKFIAQYVGQFAGGKVEIGKSSAGGGRIGLDAISGATVTVIAENQVVMRSAYAIARQVGIVKSTPRPAARFTAQSATLDWPSLVDEGSVQHLIVQPDELGIPASGQPYIDLYFGYLNAPAVGRSILGEAGWKRLMADLKPDEHAIFIVANGTASFKGSGFVRGGIYDRIQVAQEVDSHTFRDTDYLNLYGIAAAGAPAYKESGIFILRGSQFSAAYPWSLVFLANKIDRASGSKTFANFEREYWLPDRYLEGGRPQVLRPDPTWLQVWRGKKLEIALFVLLLAATAGLYAMRDRLVRMASRKDKRWVSIPKYIVWSISIGFVGFFALAQPSITHVMTWLHSLVYQWRWELFLSDPLIFIFWLFIAATLFIWGRGLFCGWLCPYGSLSELSFKLAGRLGLKRFQFHLPMVWHNRLRWLKYGIFALLVGVSFYDIGLAEQMAEVEPFKSTFLVGGVWNRAWPFVAYWGTLFVLGLFVERPFCKYLCPLGAGLAIPTTLRFIQLKRKAECTTCHACQKGCGSLAIADDGRIDQRECLLCLECQILYYDTHSCPPLAQERRRRTRGGLELTPIGDDGYYIPIKAVP